MSKDKVLKLCGGSGVEAIKLFGDVFDFNSHICWSSLLLKDNHDKVSEIYKRFIDAGTDIVTTLSYQADPLNISSAFNVSLEEACQLIAESVYLAQKLKPLQRKLEVAASIGCYGTHLADASEYTGDYIVQVNPKDVQDLYISRIKSLITANPDYLAFETIPTIEEVILIRDIVREYPNFQCWISMSCPNSGDKLAHGDKLVDAIKVLKKSSDNLIGIGLNCAIPLSQVSPAIKTIKEHLGSETQKKIIVYPNSGEIQSADDKSKFFYPSGITESTFSKLVSSWCSDGANIVGGCCGMSAERMQKVYEEIDIFNNGIV